MVSNSKFCQYDQAKGKDVPLTTPFRSHTRSPYECKKSRKGRKTVTDWEGRHKTVIYFFIF